MPDRYDSELLRNLSNVLFRKIGYSAEESNLISDVITSADLYGISSHGFQRLALYVDGVTKIGRIKIHKKPKIISETPSSAVIDGNETSGQVASMLATNMAIGKAKEKGVGIVVVKNSNHFGIAGYYTRHIMNNDLLGIAMTNTEAIMVPTNGKKPMLGTNPISIAMKATPYPYVFDASTSVVTRGKLEVHAKEGKDIPLSWAVGSDGNTSGDVRTILQGITNKEFGGILPLGGMDEVHGSHKGYGLGLAVELFTGILSGGITSNYVREHFNSDRCSHMFMAIDYGMFGDKHAIENSFSQYLDEIRNSAVSSPELEILTHGQKELREFNQNVRRGIKLDKKTITEIERLCEEFALESKEFLSRVG